MVNTCCVKSCQNHTWKCVMEQKPRPKMHAFPEEESRCSLWVMKTQVKVNSFSSLRVCSLHFSSNDYVKKLSRTELSKTAVPSVHLPDSGIIHRVLLPSDLKGSRTNCLYEAKLDDKLTILLSFNTHLFVENPACSINIPGVRILSRERDSLKDELSAMHERNRQLEDQLKLRDADISKLQKQLKRLKQSRKRQKQLKEI